MEAGRDQTRDHVTHTGTAHFALFAHFTLFVVQTPRQPRNSGMLQCARRLGQFLFGIGNKRNAGLAGR
jgi:hypothetical protein